uniref:Uncharacterized protein n=1 Tax=Tanacetum cinerariifolium TaxID=118510 RepID=A0A6L2JFU6_TANCI|nr:hypothetical protein [Tanacetum cinerariifolium]
MHITRAVKLPLTVHEAWAFVGYSYLGQLWGIIADTDVDEDVTLKDVAAVAKEVKVEKTAEIKENAYDDELEPAELKELVEVVTTAKLMAEVVTAASATITAADTPITTAPSAA